MKVNGEEVKILSIIVPSYNVEKYLEHTLKSFIEETVLEDIEVIIVDDGSTDSTKHIAEKYCEKYSNTFRLISKKNGGHGSTINCGIETAIGKYFKVVDGDDWINTEAFGRYIKRLKESTADYIVSDYCTIHEFTGEKKEICFPQLNRKKICSFNEIADRIQIPMHALAIKTEILKCNHIKLDEHCFYVDVEYILFPVPYVKTVEYVKECIYIYRIGQTTQSVSFAGSRKHIDDYVKVTTHLSQFYESYKPEQGENEKKEYILNRVSQMVADTASVFFSFTLRDKTVKSKLQNYMYQIQKISPEIYINSLTFNSTLKRLCETRFRQYKGRVVLYRCIQRRLWLRNKKINEILLIIMSKIKRVLRK